MVPFCFVVACVVPRHTILHDTVPFLVLASHSVPSIGVPYHPNNSNCSSDKNELSATHHSCVINRQDNVHRRSRASISVTLSLSLSLSSPLPGAASIERKLLSVVGKDIVDTDPYLSVRSDSESNASPHRFSEGPIKSVPTLL